jgi:hypothetical protein
MYEAMPLLRQELLNFPFQQWTEFNQDVNCESNDHSTVELNAVQHLQ